MNPISALQYWQEHLEKSVYHTVAAFLTELDSTSIQYPTMVVQNPNVVLKWESCTLHVPGNDVKLVSGETEHLYHLPQDTEKIMVFLSDLSPYTRSSAVHIK